jgi:hypothetical protein
MRYALRLISFASATACVIFSLIGVFLLLTGCNYAHHRFPPSVKILVFPTILIGVGFFISAFVYRWFIQNSTKPPSLQADPAFRTLFGRLSTRTDSRQYRIFPVHFALDCNIHCIT